ncbi:ExeA family protein [Tropicimonas sp.]|uniref:ExeA family protein n=1 Tax=Tropicimonas sp. TaxID=2067044 RepID=UPI003A891164
MSDEMYAPFFGLSRRPFTLLPDPAFMFWSPQHQRAFSVLEYGLMSRAPITLITGEVGAGKTTLVHALLQNMPAEFRVGLISNAQGDRGELLQWALHALDIPFDETASYVQNFRKLQDFLIAEYAAGRRVVLIFDEAQNLSRDRLEELRMLTNINSNRDEIIQLILVGQPELRAIVRSPDMRQLAQRVSASFHLAGLDEAGTAELIRHRLRMAGGTGGEIAPEAIVRIYQRTRGVPRLINQLADFAMLYAWTAEETVVSADDVAQVIADGVFFYDAADEEVDG